MALRNNLVRASVVLAALHVCLLQAQAGERVTLRNGFAFDCVRRELQQSGTVRLFFAASPAAESSNYLDVPAASVVLVEPIPDPVPTPLPTISAASAHSASAAAPLTPQALNQMVARSGAQHNIDADLLASIVRAESNGAPHAVSRAGAQGLMQLMPSTASQMGILDSFIPDQNVEGGARYLDTLLIRYHDNIALALAAYNAGPGAVDRYRGVPPFRETRAYVARVIREFNRRKTILVARSH